jgi:hypothetical protein
MSFGRECAAVSWASPSKCWQIRYSNRSDTAAIIPERSRALITAGQRQVRRSVTRQGLDVLARARVTLVCDAANSTEEVSTPDTIPALSA